MDEVSMFTALRPAPLDDASQIRERARARLDAELTAGAPAPVRAHRRRRRPLVLAATAAAVAAAAAAAIAVPTLLPGGPRPFITSAWAVQPGQGGAIIVTINKTLRDQAALQRALRADGVPAYVRSMSGCKYWEPRGGLRQIRHDWKALDFPAPGNPDKNFGEIVIHPAALPGHDAIFIGGDEFDHGDLSLQLFVMRNNHPPVCVPGIGVRAGRA